MFGLKSRTSTSPSLNLTHHDMYKNCDQVGEQEKGLNSYASSIFVKRTKIIRRALSGVLLSSGVAIVGLERNNDALLGTGMFMAYVTTFQVIAQMRNLRQNIGLDEFSK